MNKHAFLYFFAFAAAVAASSALAGAGQTGAGVTTTTGTIDPTTATQNVQSQSSNFVQENQAAQTGQVTPNGTPVASAAAIGTAASRTGAAGTAGDPSNPSNGKPGDPNNPASANAQAASAPPVPAAPPPEYVSNIKKVNRDAAPTGVAVVDTATPTGTAGATQSSAPIAAAVPNSAPADNVVGAPGAQRQNSAAMPRSSRPVDATKVAATDRASQQPATPASGSGTAPDSYAFYIGIVIAGVLLAFAASTFFRSDKGSVK